MGNDQQTRSIAISKPGLRWSRSASTEHGYTFGPFTFLPQRQLLINDGAVVRLGGRAIVILEALVDRAGEYLTNEELTRIGWPTTIVEEGNLRVHISAIRRALNDPRDAPVYIANSVGRGYRFIAPVSESEVKLDAPPRTIRPQGSMDFLHRWYELLDVMRRCPPSST